MKDLVVSVISVVDISMDLVVDRVRGGCVRG